jgi:hypothetical protein
MNNKRPLRTPARTCALLFLDGEQLEHEDGRVARPDRHDLLRRVSFAPAAAGGPPSRQLALC